MRKLPTPKDHQYLAEIKSVRYQVGDKTEMHKEPRLRGMISRASARWYLTQTNRNVELATWLAVIDRQLILSANKTYVADILDLATQLHSKYGTMAVLTPRLKTYSTIWNDVIAKECDAIHQYIYNTYEIPRLQMVEETAKWVKIIDPEGRVHDKGVKVRKKTKAHTRFPLKRYLKRIAKKLFDKYGKADDNANFYSENFGSILKWQEYSFKTKPEYIDAAKGFEILIGGSTL